MSSVINTNVTAIRTQNIYNRNNDYMSDAMRKVATGMKINSAKDNSSVWAITEKMKERIRANDQANQNIQNDTALLKTAEDGLGNTLDILKTLKERAINSANDSNISSDRSKIVEEVRQLAMQIDDNAAKVKFNGRQLLNGGVEATSGTSGVSSAGTVSPQAVTATGTYADKAVYALTGFSLKDGSAVASGSVLINLVGEDGETLFQKGDQITFNWTDNGTQKTSTITVEDTTALSDLNPGASSLSGAFAAAGATTGATSTSGSTIKASADGVYLTSTNANHNISNLSIAVTTSTGATRTAAQDALTPTAIAQSYGNPNVGSNMVYSTGKTATTPRGDLTTLTDLSVVAKDSATATITINDVQLKFAGSTSLKEISEAFKQKGIDVEFHYVETAGDPLTYEGNTVTMGTYGSTAAYGGTGNVSVAGLNVVGGSNQYIYKVNLTGTASTDGTKKLSLDDTGASGISSVTSPTLPQGGPLQFFVGGEQNFGVNFTLGKATVGNLLGGTADTFASKFQTKEGAESALGIIDTAISKVLTEQTKVGAMEARLGYTSDNIVSMNENLDAGVSAYRDTDMAKEMTNYMKYSVLSQASQYMLSQASQNAFSVLNLLQQ